MIWDVDDDLDYMRWFMNKHRVVLRDENSLLPRSNVFVARVAGVIC